MAFQVRSTSILSEFARSIGRRVPQIRTLIETRNAVSNQNDKLKAAVGNLSSRNLQLVEDNARLRAERDWIVRDSSDLREELRRSQLAIRRARGHSDASATKGLCEVMNPARFQDDDWLALHNNLERYAMDKHCFWNFSGAIHRKAWEWTHCVYGLRQLGMLKPEHRGVGVGAGRECVIFFLADHVAHVTATDLYGEDSWAVDGGKEADLAMVEEAKTYCPQSVDFSKVSFRHQDGTNLSYASDTFDFAWSLSSIEHFGGHAAARRALQEMARVVRPGGIVAVATEVLLLDEHTHAEFFTRQQIISELVEPCTDQLELVSAINFDTLPFEYLVDSICVPEGVRRNRRHVVLNDGNVQWTSILLFFRKRR
jgi:SAM-dependent methyltransferase